MRAVPSPFSLLRVPRHRLSEDEKEELWSCYSRFVTCSRKSFMDTLSRADEVYVIRDKATGALHGFEALTVVTIGLAGKAQSVLFTFYADLDPAYRGRNILQQIGVWAYLKLRLRHPFRPIFWMFTASTYTSYLLLPRNFDLYWPNPNTPTPPFARAIMDAVVIHLKRAGWDAEAGVLRREGVLRYREGVVADNGSMLADPDIAFYALANPGQPEGDSLVCLCPLTARNVLIAIMRMIRRISRKATRR